MRPAPKASQRDFYTYLRYGGFALLAFGLGVPVWQGYVGRKVDYYSGAIPKSNLSRGSYLNSGSTDIGPDHSTKPGGPTSPYIRSKD
ncbi:unnamed protein product [Pedinophyceae sp. YPF-701]|nr:unnamed protein product [Pedinophyceae sp. YPF-701]